MLHSVSKCPIIYCRVIITGLIFIQNSLYSKVISYLRINVSDSVEVSYADDIIILLNSIFTDPHGYQIMPGLRTNKQRKRLLLLKTGTHAASTHLYVTLSFGNISRD